MRHKISIVFVFLCQWFSLYAEANVLGNMQTFAPNPDSMIFQNIHSSQTLEKNYFNIGLFAAYVRNELSVYDSLTTLRFVEYKDKAATFDFIFAWGVTPYLELTYSMPGYFTQSPDSGQAQQNFISSGVNGHRLGFKYNVSKNPTGGFAVAASADLTQTEDNPYIGNSPEPIWNAELIYDTRDQYSGYGFNLGYRKRTPGSPANNAYFLPISDQLIASAGYVRGLSTRWRFHLETFGSYGLKKENHPEQTYISSLEFLVGGKYLMARNLWGHYGATAEAIPKGLAPDYRIYAGINYFFGLTENKPSEAPKDPVPVNETPALTVTPAESTIYTGGVVQFSASGGKGPYKASLSPASFGNISKLKYIAPTRSGEVEVLIRDQSGQIATARIHVVPIPKTTKALVLKNLNFIFNSDQLTGDSQKELDRNIANISGVKVKKMIVIGHTDSKGSENYNQVLSQKRAEAVAKILRQRFNLQDEQVEAVGYGESQPVATNDTEAGRLRNRRCELKLYYDQ